MYWILASGPRLQITKYVEENAKDLSGPPPTTTPPPVKRLDRNMPGDKVQARLSAFALEINLHFRRKTKANFFPTVLSVGERGDIIGGERNARAGVIQSVSVFCS